MSYTAEYTPEDHAAVMSATRRRWFDNLSPQEQEQERRESSDRMNATHTPESRAAVTRQGWAKRTPQERAERSAKSEAGRQAAREEAQVQRQAELEQQRTALAEKRAHFAASQLSAPVYVRVELQNARQQNKGFNEAW